MRIVSVLLYGLFLIVYSPRLSGAIYNVSTASELNAIVPLLQPGDEVVFRNGVWSNADILLDGIGTAENPIIFKAETVGGVVFSGNSKMRIAGKYLVVSGFSYENGYATSQSVIEFRNGSKHATYCRLTNVSIKNYSPPEKLTDTKWVSLYGERNRVDHCSFEGKTNSGTTLIVWMNDKPDYHVIDYNYFGPRSDLGINGGETIRIGTSDWSLYSSNTLVENNLFEECDGEIEIISSKSCHNIYRYNTFLNCNGTLTLRHGDDCEVYGNFFIDKKGKSGSGGVRIIGRRHKVYNNYFEGLNGDQARAAISVVNGILNSPLNGYYQVEDAKIGFNTIIDCKEPFAIGALKSSTNTMPPLRVLVANNLVKCRAGRNMVRIYEPASEVSWEGNLVNGSSGIPENPGIKPVTINFLSDNLILRPELNPLQDNPATTALPEISLDIDLQARPSGLRHPGCDQVMEGPVLNKPLTRSETGVQIDPGNHVLKKPENRDVNVYKISSDILKVDFKTQKYRILSLYSMEGKMIRQIKGNESSHSISMFERSGMYLLHVIDMEDSFSIKFWF
jgi:poly(beta-D-mannuronate) lyase